MALPAIYGTQPKMTRRLAAIVLGSEAPVVGFAAVGARALAGASETASHLASTYLLAGCLLALACILAAGLLRFPWGVTLGWLVNLAAIASFVVVPVMAVVGAIFAALYWVALAQGRRMDALTEAYLREHPDEA